MRRRQFLRAGAATALAVPTLAAPAVAQSAPDIKWRMTSSFSKSMEVMFGTAQMLCRYVSEATDGKFQIVAHAAGELASSQQALDAVSSGSVECAHTPAYFYFNKDSALGFGTGFPFGLNSRQQLSWWTFGGGGDIVNSALKRLNVHGIPAGLTGVQMGAWFKKEINSLDDGELIVFVFITIGAILSGMGQYWFGQTLIIRWREWMTQRYVALWMAEGRHYRIRFVDQSVDNIHLRIGNDVLLFIQRTHELGTGFLQSIVSLLSFAYILWGISVDRAAAAVRRRSVVSRLSGRAGDRLCGARHVDRPFHRLAAHSAAVPPAALRVGLPLRASRG